MAIMSALLGQAGITAVVVRLVALAFLFLVVRAILRYRKLRQFKGPFWASISRSYIFWHSIRRRLAEAEAEALEKYGCPVRLASNLLVTDDPDMIRHMNAPRSLWTRSHWYDAMRHDPRLDSVFSTRDEKIHGDLRTNMIGAYNGRDIDTIEPETDRTVQEFVELIRTTYNKKPMDIAITSQLFTLDVLSSVAFGESFGYVKANEDIYRYAEASHAFMAALELASNISFFRKLFYSSFFRWLTAPQDSDELGVGPILKIARRAVAQRFVPDTKPNQRDMLGHMVNKGFNQLECEVEAYLQIIGGGESTTTTIRTTMFLLAGTPAVFNKLRAEIDQAEEEGKVSYPVIKYDEARQLPYLTACIWEALRLYPPLFGLMTKCSPPEGDTFKGIHYPRGIEVGVSPMTMTRRKDIFGEDADVFRPDRWIEADPETRAEYDRTVQLVFGVGRFECLGKHIAMVELHKVFTELIRNFDWAITNPLKGINQHGHGVHVQSNMFLTPTIRER